MINCDLMVHLVSKNPFIQWIILDITYQMVFGVKKKKMYKLHWLKDIVISQRNDNDENVTFVTVGLKKIFQLELSLNVIKQQLESLIINEFLDPDTRFHIFATGAGLCFDPSWASGAICWLIPKRRPIGKETTTNCYWFCHQFSSSGLLTHKMYFTVQMTTRI